MKSYKRLIVILLIIVALVGIILALILMPEPVPVPDPIVEETGPKVEVIGKSVQGREIEAYTYGDGQNKLLFVGGVHGGYEWNSVLLSYRFMDYLESKPEVIPANVSVVVIPNLNPDGVFKVIGKEGRFTLSDVRVDKEGTKPGRFNANEVDLNRNFDCKWKPESTWQSKVVSAGTAPFSEPEAVALRDFVLKDKPEVAIFFHSQSNAVYASECENGILPKTREIMNTYSNATGYKAVDVFDAYEITGDAEGWLASINVPAITVELETHETIEWEKNWLGIKALFSYFK